MSSLNSLKVWFKDFAINSILPKMPTSFLCWIFVVIMRPRAQNDIEAICKYFFEQKDVNSIIANEPLETLSPIIIAMVGLPQTGKTTVARAMMVNLGFVHIDSNQIRMWLINEKRDYRNIDAIVLFLMASLLSQGYSVIMDSDCVSPGKRAFIKALSNRCCGKVEMVHVHVKCEALVWRDRLMDSFIHRMYADGVRLSHDSSQKRIPRSELEKCVVGEYVRHLPIHMKYSKDVKGIAIDNNGPEEELRRKALEACSGIRAVYRKVIPTLDGAF